MLKQSKYKRSSNSELDSKTIIHGEAHYDSATKVLALRLRLYHYLFNLYVLVGFLGLCFGGFATDHVHYIWKLFGGVNKL